MTHQPHPVAVVDPDPIARRGAVAALEAGGLVVRAFASAGEMLAWTGLAACACVVIDPCGAVGVLAKPIDAGDLLAHVRAATRALSSQEPAAA